MKKILGSLGKGRILKKPAIFLSAFFIFLQPLSMVYAQDLSSSPDSAVQNETGSGELAPVSSNDTLPPDFSKLLDVINNPTKIDTEIGNSSDSGTLSEQSPLPENTNLNENNSLQEKKNSIPEKSLNSLAALNGTVDYTAATYPTYQKFNSPQADTLSGALSYSYPLDVPLGRRGLQPSISIVYNNNNHGNDSVIGYGWSLDVPYIERINKTGINNLYNENYFYSSLSGELATTSTTTTYDSKVENGEFINYTFSNNSWIVIDKKGNVYKFGISVEGRQDNPNDNSKVFKWMLQEVRDTNDNYIKYEYYKESGQIYPSVITYTGSGATDGIFTISFERDVRNDSVEQYKTGFSVITKYRISRIQASENVDWVKRWDLGYENGSNGKRSLLSTITESGKDALANITTLPALNLLNLKNTNLGVNRVYPTMPESYRADAADFADINGDGYMDIVSSYDTGTPYATEKKVYLNNRGNGWTTNSNYNLPVYFLYEISSVIRIGHFVQDFNGDGLADVLYVEAQCGGWCLSSLKAYINTGNGWVENTAWEPSFQFYSNNGSTDKIMLRDLNNDGLPELITEFGTTDVHLNLGTGWSEQSQTGWGLPGGVLAKDTLIGDINGDGILDVMQSQHRDYLQGQQLIQEDTKQALLGVGNGTFVPSASYTPPTMFRYNHENWGNCSTGECNKDVGVRLLDYNGDGLADLLQSTQNTYLDPNNLNQSSTVQRVYLNTGNGWASSTNISLDVYFTYNGIAYPGGTLLFDLNGDGSVDFGGGSTIYRLTNSTPSDTLKGIIIPTGATYSIEYKAASQYVNAQGQSVNIILPDPVQTVSKINSYEPLSNSTSTTSYFYESSDFYYSSSTPYERKFTGYNQVSVTDGSGNVTKTFFHQGNGSDSSRGEYNDHISKVGKPYRIEYYDNSGNLYSKIINQWDSSNFGNESVFVKLSQTLKSTYDGDSTHRDKLETYIYNDATGDKTQKVEWGEILGSDNGVFSDVGLDKFVTVYTYATNSASSSISFVSSELVTDQNNTKVKESKYYYDNLAFGTVTKGNLTKQEDWKTGTTYVNKQKSYNSLGLVVTETDQRGKVTTYGYDTYNLYPITITNPVNHITRYTYDYSSGQIQQVTDPNGNIFQNVYDGIDRLLEQKQPDPSSTSTLQTKVSFVYTDTTENVSVKQSDNLDDSVIADTYTYYDGLGRKIQERKEAESGNFSVKDYHYNNVGLMDKESLPYFSSGGSKTLPTSTTQLYTNYTYDTLGRIITKTDAVGTTATSYTDWKTTVIDPRTKTKDFYSDAFGNLTQVDEHEDVNIYTTVYTYDYLKSLKSITDALGNVRNFTYDGLGERLTAQDLHSPSDSTYGNYTFTYDNAGNLTQMVNPNGQTINYTYDNINRQLTENYTGLAGTEIIYTYDTCAQGKGKLCTASSSSVSISNNYNALGQLVSSASVINGASYLTSYTYDRLGNQLSISNPDGSQIKYIYNNAGLLETTQRKEFSDEAFVNVVTSLNYAPTGQIQSLTYGNGVNAVNTYDAAALYRLSSKVSTIGTSTLQNISYIYDANGNITRITDSSTTHAARGVDYEYDDLNRLISASTTTASMSPYRYLYNYDALGNILSKNENGLTTTYTYATSTTSGYMNPHAISKIGSSSYTYDKNGNVTADGRLKNTWDYRNNLVQSVVPTNIPIATATLTFFAIAGDGSINADNASWDIAHDSATGTAVSYSGTTGFVRTGKNSSTSYRIERAFLPFNTITLPDSALIVDAKLKLYINGKLDDDNDGDDWITIVNTSQRSVDSLTVGEFDLAGSINNPVEGIDITERKDISNIPDLQYLTFTLNDTGKSWVSKTGNTWLGLREGHDVIDDPFVGTSTQYNQLQFRTNNYTGTSTDPILQVVYATSTLTSTTTNAYDPWGQRVKQTIGGTTTAYPSKYYNTDGITPTKDIFLPDGTLIATVVGTGTSTVVSYTHTDHLDGMNVATDNSGNVVELADYYPYGSTRLDEKNGLNSQRKFIGEMYDKDTGLNYLNARYYSANNGRFISQDSLIRDYPEVFIDDPQQLNFYSYARNNPITLSDPSGNFSIKGMTKSVWNSVSTFFSNLFGQSNNNNSNQPQVSTSPVNVNQSDNKPVNNTPTVKTTTWDSKSDERIKQLDSRLQQPATNFINEVESQQKIQLRVTQGYRSIDEQNSLYAQGRTTKGNIVTNAKGGDSYHNYGLAFDVVVMEKSEAKWDKPMTQDIANIAARQGFEWGGSWSTFPDYPHFQMTFGQSLSDLKKGIK